MCLVVVVKSKDGLTLMPDGLRVYQGPDIIVEEGVWTIAVLITDPMATFAGEEIDRIATEASKIEELVRDANEWITHIQRDAWRRRLQVLINEGRTLERKRRGLADIVGKGLNWAFGVATSDQVEVVRKAVDKLGKSNRVVTHNQQMMFSMINETRRAEIETRAKVNGLVTAINAYGHQIQSLWSSLNYIARQLTIDTMITSMEAWFYEIRDSINRMKRREILLAQGALGRDLLPQAELMKIAARGESLGLKPLEYAWYYVNARVEWLWSEGPHTYFVSTIVFGGTDEYQSYLLSSWPVPVSKEGKTLKLEVQKNIAFIARTGRMFTPQDCIGKGPSVCRTGPLSTHEMWACERGIITGHPADRNTCIFREGQMDKTTEVYEIIRGQYVIQTTGETYSLSCEGQRQIKSDMDMGTYTLDLEGKCEFAGDGWTLSGEILRLSNVTIIRPRVRVGTFNLSDLKEDADKIIPLIDRISTLTPIAPINFLLEKDETMYEAVHHNITWANIIAITIICVAGVAVLIWIYKRRDRLRFFLTRKSHMLKLVKPIQKMEETFDNNRGSQTIDNNRVGEDEDVL